MRVVSTLETLAARARVSFSSQRSEKVVRSTSTSVSRKQPSKAIACTASILYIPEAWQQRIVILHLAGAILVNYKYIKQKIKKAFSSVLFPLWRAYRERGYLTMLLSVGPAPLGRTWVRKRIHAITHTCLTDYCQLLTGNMCPSFWNRKLKLCLSCRSVLLEMRESTSNISMCSFLRWLSNHVSNICTLFLFFPLWYSNKWVYMGGYSRGKGFKWVLHRKQMFNLWTFMLQADFSKNDLVIHLVLGQKGIIKPIFLIENGEAGEGEIDSASQERGGNTRWVHSGVYFRERKNTLINRYLSTEWRLPSSGGVGVVGAEIRTCTP